MRVTVPVAVPPGRTVGGERERAETPSGGVTWRLDARETPASSNETQTHLSYETGSVVSVKGAERAPSGTVTVEGTLATAGSEDESETTRPPAGAGVPSRTVPVTWLPPSAEGVSRTSSGSGLPKPTPSKTTVKPASHVSWRISTAMTSERLGSSIAVRVQTSSPERGTSWYRQPSTVISVVVGSYR
ncbi:MAG: hypothetical protein DYH06_14120 [Acidobacteria bacterium ACB2]|nr:hypothetical protein [Acidobacteria bacterium ACB2]